MNSESGKLYIVATPIGNLSDTSPRVIETLKAVDYILAEDTRVTLKILQHAGIVKKMYSYSEHSSPVKEQAILDELLAGKNYALVSDAGTPCVSDPGARLVDLVIKAGITVVPLPGPSAVTALLSVLGVPFASFHFWGFFPQKKIRQRELVEMFDNVPGAHVFFESPFRIVKTLRDVLLAREDFHVVIGREMTKQFESFYRGTPAQVLEQLEADVVKGEFCVAVIKL